VTAPGRGSRAIALALVLLLVAIGMPDVDLPGRATDTIVVFDITQSMDVEDVQVAGAPMARLAFAREAAHAALRELPCGSRVGWAAFAEYRTLLLLAPIEVCAHYHDLRATLDQIDGRMRWGNASEVAKGLFWALRVATASEGHPQVVFVTDGHEAPPLHDTLAPFDDTRPGEIRGWVLGIGGDEPRPIPKTGADGRRMGYWRADDVVQEEGDGPRREHLSSLHEPHLQALARQVGFGYARLQTAAVLQAAMQDDSHGRRRPVPTDVRWIPMLLALGVLAWRFRPSRSVPRHWLQRRRRV
jgi:mxaL protein